MIMAKVLTVVCLVSMLGAAINESIVWTVVNGALMVFWQLERIIDGGNGNE